LLRPPRQGFSSGGAEAWPVSEDSGVRDVAQSTADTAADVVVLVAEDGSSLAVGSTCDLDTGAVVERATDAFGGGGSPTVAQAGGLGANADEVLALYEAGLPAVNGSEGRSRWFLTTAGHLRQTPGRLGFMRDADHSCE